MNKLSVQTVAGKVEKRNPDELVRDFPAIAMRCGSP
jgi:hypothetical protein